MTDKQTPSPSDALLPCPFCGAAASGYEIEPHMHSGPLKAIGIPDHGGSYVIEGDCACGSGLIGATQSEVTARWNRRAQPAPARVTPDMVESLERAIDALRDMQQRQNAVGARLQEIGERAAPVQEPQPMQDLTQLTERGAKAWTGVDAQALREGREPQRYRLLEHGRDKVEVTDEFLKEDGVTWSTDLASLFADVTYQRDILPPGRRPIDGITTTEPTPCAPPR
jgi:hypothetical protein